MNFKYWILFTLISLSLSTRAQFTGGAGDGHGRGSLLNYTYDNGEWYPESPKSVSMFIEDLPNNLYVKSGRVTVGNTLTVRRVEISPGAYLVSDGNNLNISDSLILLADSTGYASYRGLSQSKMRMQQYVKATGWTHMGLPLSNAMLSEFGTVNTAVHPNTRNIYAWDEPNSDWVDPVGGGDGSSVANIPAKGYVLWVGNYGVGAEKSVLECTGSVAEQVTPALLSNDGSSNDPNKDGWNLVANPFPCPLDFSTLNTTDLLSSFSIWDPSTAKYLDYSPLVGDLVSSLIAPMQAFWVKANGPNPSLGSSLSMRTQCAIADEPQFYKNNYNQLDRFQLIVADLEDRSINDQIVVGLVKGTSDSLDAEWDAFKRPNHPTSPSLSMEIKGQSLSINALDFDPASGRSKRIPIGFVSSQHGGLYRIHLNNSLMLQSLDYVLEDQLMNERHNLEDGPYDFRHDTSYSNRFVLHLSGNQERNGLQLESIESETLNFSFDGAQLHVWGETDRDLEGILYALNGQQLYQFQYPKQSSGKDYILPHLRAGIYLLKLGDKVYRISKQ